LVSASRVVPGFQLGDVTFGEGPLELLAQARVGQLLQRQRVHLLHRVGPVGVQFDEQRRVLEAAHIVLQLLQRRVQVFAGTLVFPRKAAALPHVGPAVAAAGLERALLEGVPLAPGIGVGRRLLAQHPAQVDEMRLRAGALAQLGVAPLGDEGPRGHGRE
jgi:hypothetical protein